MGPQGKPTPWARHLGRGLENPLPAERRTPNSAAQSTCVTPPAVGLTLPPGTTNQPLAERNGTNHLFTTSPPHPNPIQPPGGTKPMPSSPHRPNPYPRPPPPRHPSLGNPFPRPPPAGCSLPTFYHPSSPLPTRSGRRLPASRRPPAAGPGAGPNPHPCRPPCSGRQIAV